MFHHRPESLDICRTWIEGQPTRLHGDKLREYLSLSSKRIAKEVDDNDCRYYIFSSEHLGKLRTHDEIFRLQSFLSEYFDDYKVIYYARHPWSACASKIAEQVKENAQDLYKLVRAADPIFDRFQSDLSIWEAVFPNQVHVREFSPSKLANLDLVDDFLETAIGESGFLPLGAIGISANESLSLEALLLANCITKYYPKGSTTRPSSKSLTAVLSKVKGRKFSLPRQMYEILDSKSEADLRFLMNNYSIDLQKPHVVPIEIEEYGSFAPEAIESLATLVTSIAACSG